MFLTYDLIIHSSSLILSMCFTTAEALVDFMKSKTEANMKYEYIGPHQSEDTNQCLSVQCILHIISIHIISQCYLQCFQSI